MNPADIYHGPYRVVEGVNEGIKCYGVLENVPKHNGDFFPGSIHVQVLLVVAVVVIFGRQGKEFGRQGKEFGSFIPGPPLVGIGIHGPQDGQVAQLPLLDCHSEVRSDSAMTIQQSSDADVVLLGFLNGGVPLLHVPKQKRNEKAVGAPLLALEEVEHPSKPEDQFLSVGGIDPLHPCHQAGVFVLAVVLVVDADFLLGVVLQSIKDKVNETTQVIVVPQYGQE